MKNRGAYNNEPPNFKRISSPYLSIEDDVLGFFTGKRMKIKRCPNTFSFDIPPVLLLAKIEIH
jgi:hypothetical protein